jgi:phenylacetate-CoA oxygenase PaaJ subunit
MIERSPTETQLLQALHDVEDPELPISVVDMGLIVGLEIRESVVDVQLTFTAMGCPAMDMIVDDVRARLLREPGVEEVHVEIVWHPIWTKASMTDEGRAQLREWGISV